MNITSITSSIEKHFELHQNYTSHPILDCTLKSNPQNVVMIVIDALGENVLKHHAPYGFLNAHKKDLLQTVIPATTVAANTTLKTGLMPHQHGRIGWSQYFSETNEVVNIFSNTNFDTDQPSKLSVPSYIPTCKTIVEKIKEHGGMAYEVMPEWAENGCKTFDEWCARIRSLCHENGKKYIYAYWGELDSKLHFNGIGAAVVQQTIDMMEEKLARLSVLVPDTVFVITADHGHKKTQPLYLSRDYPEIVKMMAQPNSLETRCAAFHIKDEYKDVFPEKFKSLFPDFRLLTGQDFIRLLGGCDHPHVKDAVGDYVALARGSRSLTWKYEKEWVMTSEHAGLTYDELEVPLIIVKSSYGKKNARYKLDGMSR